MRTRRKELGAALAAAAVVGFGAYALGTQAGDGSAAAGADGGDGREGPAVGIAFGPGGCGREELADRLGVEASELEDALADVRRDLSGDDPRDEFAAALADALGLPRARVAEALEAAKPRRVPVPPGHRGPGFDGLADELGVSQDELESAMDEVRDRLEPRFEERREEFANALAERLDIPVERVEEALPDHGPHPAGPPGPPPGP